MVTYDAGKLERALPRILEEHGKMSAKSLAKDARERIKKGLRPALKKSTKEISKKGLSGKRGRGYPRSSNKPLIHSGSLLASIKANTGDNEGEVEANAYIKHHMEGYIVPPPGKRNNWAIKFNTQGRPVPRRNPFFTKTGRLYKSVGMKDHLKELHKLIHKAFKGKKRWINI